MILLENLCRFCVAFGTNKMLHRRTVFLLGIQMHACFVVKLFYNFTGEILTEHLAQEFMEDGMILIIIPHLRDKHVLGIKKSDDLPGTPYIK